MVESLPSYEAAMRDARAYLRRRDLTSEEEIPLYFAWQRLYATANANLGTDFMQETGAEFRFRQEARLAPRRGVPPPLFTTYDKIRRTSAQASAFLRESPSDVAIEAMARRYRREAEKLRLSRDKLISSLNEVEKCRKKVRIRKKPSHQYSKEIVDSSEGEPYGTEELLSGGAETEKLTNILNKRTKNFFQQMNHSKLKSNEDNKRSRVLPVSKLRVSNNTGNIDGNRELNDFEDEFGAAVNSVKAADLTSAATPSEYNTANLEAFEVPVADWRMPSDVDSTFSVPNNENIGRSIAIENHLNKKNGLRESAPVVGEEEDMTFDTKSRRNRSKEEGSDLFFESDAARSETNKDINVKALANKDKQIASLDAGVQALSHNVYDFGLGSFGMPINSSYKAAVKSPLQQKLLELKHAVGNMQVTIQGKQLHVTFTGAIEGEAGDKESRFNATESPIKMEKRKHPSLSPNRDESLNGENVEEYEKPDSLTRAGLQRKAEIVSHKPNNSAFADDSSAGSGRLEQGEPLGGRQARREKVGNPNEFTRQLSSSSVELSAIDEKDAQVESSEQREEVSKQTPVPAVFGSEDDRSKERVEVTGEDLFSKLQQQGADDERGSRCERQEHVENDDIRASRNEYKYRAQYEDAGLESVENVSKRKGQVNCGQTYSHDFNKSRGFDKNKEKVDPFKRATNMADMQEQRHCSEQQITEEEEELQNDLQNLAEGDFEIIDSRGIKEDLKHLALHSEHSQHRSQHAFNTRKESYGEPCIYTDKRVSKEQENSFNVGLVSKRIKVKKGKRLRKQHDGDHDDQMRLNGDFNHNSNENLQECYSNDFESSTRDRAEPDPLPTRHTNDTFVQNSRPLDSEGHNIMDSINNAKSETKHTRRSKRQSQAPQLYGADDDNYQNKDDLGRYAPDRASFTELRGDKYLEHEHGSQNIAQRSSRKRIDSNDAAYEFEPTTTKGYARDFRFDTQVFSKESDDSDRKIDRTDKFVTSIDQSVNGISNKYAKQLRSGLHDPSGNFLRNKQNLKAKIGMYYTPSRNERDKIADNEEEILSHEEVSGDEDLSRDEELSAESDAVLESYQDRRCHSSNRQSMTAQSDKIRVSSQSKFSRRPKLTDKQQVDLNDSCKNIQTDFDDRDKRRSDKTHHHSKLAHDSRSYHSCGIPRNSSRSSKKSTPVPSRGYHHAEHKMTVPIERRSPGVLSRRGIEGNSKLRSTKGSKKISKGIVWPPGLEEDCVARLGLDGHHPIAPPGLEHLVTDDQWADYWTWLHWYSSWQMWYMKNGKRQPNTEKRSCQSADINKAEHSREEDAINANWWVDLGSNKNKHRQDRSHKFYQTRGCK